MTFARGAITWNLSLMRYTPHLDLLVTFELTIQLKQNNFNNSTTQTKPSKLIITLSKLNCNDESTS